MVWCVWSGCKKKVKPCGKGLKVALVVVMSFQSSHDPARAATLFSVCPWRLWKDWSNDWKIHGIWWSVWNLDLEYGYESIPIDTIFSGMNIHLPAILMFTRGTRFWHTAISGSPRSPRAGYLWRSGHDGMISSKHGLSLNKNTTWLRGCSTGRVQPRQTCLNMFFFLR